MLGDAVYERGTAAEFRDCYSWRGVARPHASRARQPRVHHARCPAGITTAYFGAAAGDPTKGYYSYDLGSWHVVVLNANCGPAAAATPGPQERWLRRPRRAPSPCTLAYWHHPRFSSGLHGPDETLARSGGRSTRRADVVLAGHDHHYERFAPMDGIRSFVVGTGGRSHYPVFWRLRGAVVDDTTFGVLRLTLRPARTPGACRGRGSRFRKWFGPRRWR